MDNKRISEIVEEEMIKQDANRYRDMRKILTIPKSIADDKVVKYAVEHPNLARFVINDILEGLAIDEYPIDYENVIKWIKPLINVDRDKLNVILAYLAGKALGVDLVKVVEG